MVMVNLNKLARSMAANDIRTYQTVEKHRRTLKQHEVKARNICISLQVEKGADCRIIEYYDDQIKKFEFQLGITPGILDESLVREGREQQEREEAAARQAQNGEETIDLHLSVRFK